VSSDRRPSPRDWLACSVLGAGVGAVVLGIGGRLAMRGITLFSDATPDFSLGGTMTVILLGALWGLAGALVWMGLQALAPRRPLLWGVVFWTFLILATLRGLWPVDLMRLLLFMPLSLAYGLALQFVWCRVRWRRQPSSPALQTGSAA
jgi:hypothetical protein